MTGTGHMAVCYSHRYSQLLESGEVDDSTRIVDRDEVASLKAMGRSLGDIAGKLGVRKADLKECMSLERRLLVSERERAVSLLPPLPETENCEAEAGHDAVQPEAAGDVPDDRAVGREDGQMRTAVVAFYGGTSEEPSDRTLHIALMRAWCEASGSEPDVYVVDSPRTLPDRFVETRYGRVAVWTMDEVPESDRAWFEDRCSGSEVELVRLGGSRALWEGVFPEEDGNTIATHYPKGRWIDFCWEHQRRSQSYRITKKDGCATRFASLEGVMECSRLGIPSWAVARAVGVSTEVLRDALAEEGFLDSYDSELGHPDGVGTCSRDSGPDPVPANHDPGTDDGLEVFVPEVLGEPEGPDTDGLRVVRVGEPLITESGMRSGRRTAGDRVRSIPFVGRLLR